LKYVGKSPLEHFKPQYPDLVKECKWTAPKIREALEDFLIRTGRPPRTADLHNENGLPSYSAIQKVTGTPAGAFIQDWYAENYELTEQKETAGWGMQMM